MLKDISDSWFVPLVISSSEHYADLNFISINTSITTIKSSIGYVVILLLYTSP